MSQSITDKDASPFIRRCFDLVSPLNGTIADVACGAGRNACYFAKRGTDVICLDNDLAALDIVKDRNKFSGQLVPIHIDLEKQPLPFQSGQLAGAICVWSWRYSWRNTVLEQLRSAIRPGGFLIFETISARGQNYKELPPAGLLKAMFQDGFQLMVYKETPSTLGGASAVTVKMLAFKKAGRHL
jgi:SAM-dependent methyltransferase